MKQEGSAKHLARQNVKKRDPAKRSESSLRGKGGGGSSLALIGRTGSGVEARSYERGALPFFLPLVCFAHWIGRHEQQQTRTAMAGSGLDCFVVRSAL